MLLFLCIQNSSAQIAGIELDEIDVYSPCHQDSPEYDECFCNPSSCDSGDCTDPLSSEYPCSLDDPGCPNGETDDCSECDTDGSGCYDDDGDCTNPDSAAYPCDDSDGGSGNDGDDDDDDARCDNGFIKNMNRDCVPCPDGNCDDCGDEEFRDICGACTKEVISEPKVVKGRCNGIRTMNVMQAKTNKEVSGFFTESGKMIVLPNNHPDQSSNHSHTADRYKDSNGNMLYYFFKNSSGWHVNSYSNGNWESVEKIVGHYHTHPWDGVLSKYDRSFTTGDFSGVDHYYYIKDNSINEYNQDEVINTETINCKKNPESTDNC